MTWFDWTLVTTYVISSLIMVSQIGKPRPDITHGTAIIAVIINAALALGVVTMR